MADTETIKLILEAQDKMSKTLDEVTIKINGMKQGVDKASKSAIDLGGVFAKYLSVAAIGAGFAFIIKESADSEKAINSLKSSVVIAGGDWNKLNKTLLDYAATLQETTTFSDEQAMDVMQRLVTITGDSEKAWKQTALVLDIASTGLMSTEGAAKAVAMALEGNVQALGRVIPELKGTDAAFLKNATSAQKAEYAINLLNEKFGGRAVADLNTTAGKFKQLQNNISELAETVGGDLTPAINTLVDWLNNLTKAMKPVLQGWKILWEDVGKAVGGGATATGEYARVLEVANKAVKAGTMTQEEYNKIVDESRGIFFNKKKEEINGQIEITNKTKSELQKQLDNQKVTADTKKKVVEEFNTKYKAMIEKQTEDDLIALQSQKNNYIKNGADKLDVDKWYNAEKERINKETQDKIDKKTLETSKLMADAFMSAATDTQVAWEKLAKDITNTLVTDAFKPMAEGLNNMLGQFGSIGTVLAGGIGGVIGGVVGGFLNTLFGQSKSTAQMVKETFDWLANRTNEAISKIGQKKTAAEKKLELLDIMKFGAEGRYQGEAAQLIGVQNLTEQQATVKLLQELLAVQQEQKGMLNKSEAQVAQEMADFQKSLAEQKNILESARSKPGQKGFAERSKSSAMITYLEKEIEARKQYLARDPLERMDILKEIVDTQNKLAEAQGVEIPKYASGGIVTKPTLGLIGEKEPEMIIPLSKMNGMGQSVNVTFQTLMVDSLTVEKAAKIIDREINKLKKTDSSLLFNKNAR